MYPSKYVHRSHDEGTQTVRLDNEIQIFIETRVHWKQSVEYFNRVMLAVMDDH